MKGKMIRDDGREYRIEMSYDSGFMDPALFRRCEVVFIETINGESDYQIEIKNQILKVKGGSIVRYYKLDRLESFRYHILKQPQMVSIEMIFNNCDLVLTYPNPKQVYRDHLQIFQKHLDFIDNEPHLNNVC